MRLPFYNRGMDHTVREQLVNTVRAFHLPRYAQITDVGLYLEQVTRFVNTYLRQIGAAEITPSMVSNYVKQKTIPGPVKKAYGSVSIAYLVFVSLVKNVLSMEDIRLLESVQRSMYDEVQAYDYFCAEFEGVLRSVFADGPLPPLPGGDDAQAAGKAVLRTAVLTSVQKIYLDQYLSILRENYKK